MSKRITKVTPHQFLELYSQKIIKIGVPVLITLLLDAFLTRFIEQTSGAVDLNRSLGETMAYNDGGISFEFAIYLAIFLIIMITIVTAVLLSLYYYGYTKVIYVWMVLAVSSLLSYYVYQSFNKVPSILNVPFDWISISLLFLNLVVVGNMSIFWRAPLIVTQGFLILISILTSIVFLIIPDWTVWLLLILLVIYDSIVVLCPNGLLNLLIKKSEERGDSIPALIYSTAAYNTNEEENNNNDNNKEEEKEDEKEIENNELKNINNEIINNENKKKKPKRLNKKEGVKLGLGDFVFYGILVTRAARLGWDLVVLCILAVILGLSLTLLILAWLERPLPALPFSLILGIIFFIIGAVTFRKFSLNLRELMLVF